MALMLAVYRATFVLSCVFDQLATSLSAEGVGQEHVHGTTLETGNRTLHNKR